MLDTQHSAEEKELDPRGQTLSLLVAGRIGRTACQGCLRLLCRLISQLPEASFFFLPFLFASRYLSLTYRLPLQLGCSLVQDDIISEDTRSAGV